MSVYDKLVSVQTELKAPKNQYNIFGKYNYRSCEDILEDLKPVLKKNGATVIITDTLELVGDRYYVKATAKFVDVESGDFIENSAYAREDLSQKGMSESQITGSTSSYARKYCLNGLFLIDDTKDADTDEYQNQQAKGNQKQTTKKENAKQAPKEVSAQAPVNQTEPSKETPLVNDPDLVLHGEGMTEKRIARLKKAQEITGKNDATVLATAKAKTFEEISEANYIAVMNLFLKLMTPEQQKEIALIN